MATVQDPVCHMSVEKTEAAAKTQHKGQQYFFCSADCKKKFDKAPDKYAPKKSGGEHKGK